MRVGGRWAMSGHSRQCLGIEVDDAKEYTADRVQLLSGERRDHIEPLLAKVGGLHERMWQLAVKGRQENAELMQVVLPPINEVIDLHSAHLAMARRHLPLPIMAVLLGTAAIGIGLVGFGNGRVGRRYTLLVLRERSTMVDTRSWIGLAGCKVSRDRPPVVRGQRCH